MGEVVSLAALITKQQVYLYRSMRPFSFGNCLVVQSKDSVFVRVDHGNNRGYKAMPHFHSDQRNNLFDEGGFHETGEYKRSPFAKL